MQIVLDASVGLEICLSASGFALLQAHQLVAPPLLRSEILSALRGIAYRRAASADLVQRALDRVPEMPVNYETAGDHVRRSWSIASSLGWAKTYDAEYLALAEALDVPLLTIDGRLARGAAGIVRTVTPAEL